MSSKQSPSADLACDTASPLIDVVTDSLCVLAEHERQAINGLRQGLATRIAVARKARSFSELVRDQIDLLPDTRARLEQDHQVRLALVDGMKDDLMRVAGHR